MIRNRKVLAGLLLLLPLVFLWVSWDNEIDLREGGRRGHWHEIGLEPLGEAIVTADAIARVRLDGVTARVVQVKTVGGNQKPETLYSVALAHKFDVLEYLKGSGGNKVVALAVSEYSHTYSFKARQYLDDRLVTRDNRWDDRKAIVFLHKSLARLPSTAQTDTYFMGYISYRGADAYTVASQHYRRWLPAAAAPTSPEQRFLLEVPAAVRSGATATVSASGAASTTITLTEFKAKVADIEAEIAAGDGSEAYRECVERKYTGVKQRNLVVSIHGPPRKRGRMASGLPAQSGLIDLEPPGVVGGWPPALGFVYTWGLDFSPNGGVSRHWTAGPDADLFGLSRLGQGTLLSPVPDARQFRIYVVNTRPLPAGTYRFYINDQDPGQLVCNLPADWELENIEVTAVVTAEDGTALEALFDPVALDGVTATSVSRLYVESSKPANTAVEAIRWAAGTLQVELTLAVSFSGYHLDFIAQDGTLALTVAVDDATRVGNTLSWPVQEQPWAAGDKMMVRVYR